MTSAAFRRKIGRYCIASGRQTEIARTLALPPLPAGNPTALRTDHQSPPKKRKLDLDKRPKLWYICGVLFA